MLAPTILAKLHHRDQGVNEVNGNFAKSILTMANLRSHTTAIAKI
jgi:hypothetical protein